MYANFLWLHFMHCAHLFCFFIVFSEWERPVVAPFLASKDESLGLCLLLMGTLAVKMTSGVRRATLSEFGLPSLQPAFIKKNLQKFMEHHNYMILIIMDEAAV